MPYTKTTWNAGVAPGISAVLLNNIETQYDQAVADCVNSGGDTMTGNLNMASGTQIVHADVVATKQVYYSGYARGVASSTLWDMTGQYWNLYRNGDTPGVSTPTIRIDAANKSTEFWTNLYFPANYSFIMESGTVNPLMIRADGAHNFWLTNCNQINMIRQPGIDESYIHMEAGVPGVRFRASAGSLYLMAYNSARTIGTETLLVKYSGIDVFGKIDANLPAADAHIFRASNFNVCAFDRGGSNGDIIAFAVNGLYKGSVSISGETTFYNTFVGAHGTRLKEDQVRPPKFGVVVATGETFQVDESKPLPYIGSAGTRNDPNVYGIWTDSQAGSEAYNNATEQVASLGLYMTRVSDENGDIQAGDLLTTSTYPYEATKADDDVMRSSTLGKALESVTWADVDEDEELGYKWKVIPVTLCCG